MEDVLSADDQSSRTDTNHNSVAILSGKLADSLGGLDSKSLGEFSCNYNNYGGIAYYLKIVIVTCDSPICSDLSVVRRRVNVHSDLIGH